MSLLLDHGHADAQSYPIGMVFVEAELVVERINNAHATTAILLQTAVSSLLSKKGSSAFQTQIKKLTGA